MGTGPVADLSEAMRDIDETTAAPHPTRRAKGDDGAALVEFSFVLIPLLVLILGIVGFGMLLSVKQSVTQSAAEGARSAVGVFSRSAVAAQSPSAADLDAWKADAEAAALARMHESLSWLESNVHYSSHPDAIEYLARVHDCTVTDRTLLEDPSASVDDPADMNDCIYTKVVYHHSQYRILPVIPLIDAFLPADVVSRADVALS